MAWISVHEQVIGRKLRTLANELKCSQNEALGILIRLWLWGVSNADNEGRVAGASESELTEVFSAGLVKNLKAEMVVKALVETGWIDVDGEIILHDWNVWQSERIKIEDRKERERQRQRAIYKQQVEKQKKRGEPGNEKGCNEEVKKPDKPKGNDYGSEFEEWWKVYPRKEDKGAAYKKYQARLKDGWSQEELMEAAKNYGARMEREHTEKKYIKHPKTFLSETTPFVDYISKKENKPDSNDDDPFAEWRDGQ